MIRHSQLRVPRLRFLCHAYVSVSHHGRGSLLHTAKDQSLAVFPDLVLPIAQPVHQSWQN